MTRCPHKRAICVKVLTRAPKKPCSANRATAKVRIFNKYRTQLYCFIPGEETKQVGQKVVKVTRFSYVLLKPARVNDLPGVRYKVIRAAKRGKYTPGPLTIKQYSRSKHSVPNHFRPKRIRHKYYQQLKDKKKN